MTGSFSLCSFLGVVLRLDDPEFMVFELFIGILFGTGAVVDESTLLKHSDFIAELLDGHAAVKDGRN